MYIDWITWSIWAVGLTILIIWIIIPVREFKKLVQKKRKELRDK